MATSPVGRARREQPVGQHLDRLRLGPLAHPGQHRAVAQHQDVAALDRGRRGVGPVQPHLEPAAGEHRMPPVDGPVADRLPHPGPPPHGVDRHPAVDPARGVALVEQVRQRGEHEVVGVERVERDALRVGAEIQDLPFGDAADQVAGQVVRAERVQGGAQRVDGQRPVYPGVEDLVQHVGPGLADLQRLREQVPVVVHGDPVVAQGLGERVVLGLRLGHPEHVVEQQVGGVIRGQPLQLELGPVQDDLAQPADLGIYVEHGTRLGCGPWNSIFRSPRPT